VHKNKHGASLAISSRIPVALATYNSLRTFQLVENPSCLLFNSIWDSLQPQAILNLLHIQNKFHSKAKLPYKPKKKGGDKTPFGNTRRTNEILKLVFFFHWFKHNYFIQETQLGLLQFVSFPFLFFQSVNPRKET